MADNLIARAKAFMGLGIEDEENQLTPKASQLDIASVLKGRKEAREKDNAAYEIMIYEPKVYEDSLSISASLRNSTPVLVNLRNLDPSEGTRLIDFISGTVYAIDGHMIKVADTIFLFTPGSVRVTEAEDKNSIENDLSIFEEKPIFNRR